MKVITDAKEIVALWVSQRIRDMDGPPPPNFYEAIGFAKDGVLIAGVLYFDYRRLADGTYDCLLCTAAELGSWSRTMLRASYDYPFNQLNCSRISAHVAKSNKRSREFLERQGWKYEGLIRGGIAQGRDAVLYGMTRGECRWLRAAPK